MAQKWAKHSKVPSLCLASETGLLWANFTQKWP